MKKINLFCLLITSFGFAQVGINTYSPGATLDINGNLRIQSVTQGDSNTRTLAVDDSGIVMSQPEQSYYYLVKGQFLNRAAGSTMTIAASSAPADYPYLKSVSVGSFNGNGKNGLIGTLVGSTTANSGLLVCQGYMGNANVCAVGNPGGGTLTVNTTNNPGLTISLSAGSVTSNIYYVLEYSKTMN